MIWSMAIIITFKSILSLDNLNVIAIWIINKLQYLWKEQMQYLHDNLNMHTIYEGKMQYPHYDPNPHYM
jgi:hypothetical protein